MPILRIVNRRILRTLPAIAGLALVGYFGFHAAYGDRGLLSFRSIEQDIAEKSVQLASLRDRQQTIERRVALVSGPEVDGDLLEEEVRGLLGWTAPDEVVILAPARRNGSIN